jgi:hypothetical protein
LITFASERFESAGRRARRRDASARQKSRCVALGREEIVIGFVSAAQARWSFGNSASILM